MPEAADFTPDIYSIPVTFFESQVKDEKLIRLHRAIQKLEPVKRKVLHYYVSHTDPVLASEALGFTEPDRFWLLLDAIRKEMKPESDSADFDQDIASLFTRCQLLLEIYLELLDQQDASNDRIKRIRKRLWGGVIVMVSLVLLILVIYPLLLKENSEILFEQTLQRYPGSEAPLIVEGDSTYYYAWQLFNEEDYSSSYELFGELLNQANYPPQAEWYMALISLYKGDRARARQHLKQLKVLDPELYKFRGRWVFKRI